MYNIEIPLVTRFYSAREIWNFLGVMQGGAWDK